MPFSIRTSRRRGNLLAVAGVLAAFCSAAPAAQAATISNPYSCTTAGQTLSQVFAPFWDLAYYTPVSNSGLETGLNGWTLQTGATVLADNEPWYVGGAGTHALDLPNGSSAVTAPICIDPTYPYFRFFAKNVNANGANLEVEVLYYDSTGRVQKTQPVYYSSLAPGWQSTSRFNITVFSGTNVTSAAPVAFRFVPMGRTAHFRIDDVYVDPWSRH
jgi:hypothetical protein